MKMENDIQNDDVPASFILVCFIKYNDELLLTKRLALDRSKCCKIN